MWSLFIIQLNACYTDALQFALYDIQEQCLITVYYMMQYASGFPHNAASICLVHRYCQMMLYDKNYIHLSQLTR